jgi:hypothetical protein
VPPCVIPVAGEQICTQIFTFEELCETEGGTWYGDYTSCCALKKDKPEISILPYAASAVRDERFKLVRTENENCESETNPFDIDYEFYEVNEAAPLPKLDRSGDNLLSAPTLPPKGLTSTQRKHFNKLLAEMRAILRSESDCPGDGNLDKRVNLEDTENWQAFADMCDENPNRCSSVYDFNLDAVTNDADLEIIEANFNRRCPGFRPR